jgi:hypothetical protein
MNKPAVASTILSVVAIALSACGSRVSSPTSATPIQTTTPSPVATYTLSGFVSEMRSTVPVPLEGAQVLESTSRQAALTDINGHYSIPGLFAMSHSVSIAKEGYVTEKETVTMSEDTQLDVKLEPVTFYMLSGIVFEVTSAGQTPVEGVQIYCDSCGSPVGHTFVYTDADGFYRLSWSASGVHPLFVTKEGYQIFDPAGTLRDGFGRINAVVNGDTRFDIRLVKQ